MDRARPPLLSLDADAVEALAKRLQVRGEHLWRLRRLLLAGWDPQGGPPPVRRDRPLPARLLERLEEEVRWSSCRTLSAHASADGAHKLLIGLEDGERIEAVRLPGGRRGSGCISSQVGCAMACRFCASGLDGVVRNLAGYELLEQVALLRRTGPVERLVLMGAGEPARNPRALAAALPVLRDEAGIGPYHQLISTVGPVSAIERLAALDLPFTLALSLHAVDPQVRAALIPTQASTDPRALLDAADAYAAKTGRAYQVEWVLLGGINDRAQDARALADALRGRRAHVSLISWNAVDGLEFAAPTPEHAAEFLAVLRAAGCSAVLRRTLGQESDAACGQLRRQARASADADAPYAPN